MNIMPAVGFYWRRHEQLRTLFSGKDPGILLEFVTAIVPVVKKHYPQLNEGGILDDALQTLQAMMTESKDYGQGYPDPTQR